MTIKLQWGLNPIPENACAAWGARAILERQVLDLLADRQDFAAPEMPESGKKTFINWINETALPKLRKHIVDQSWRDDSEEVFEYYNGIFHVRASCRKSYGYCYILCWQEETQQE